MDIAIISGELSPFNNNAMLMIKKLSDGTSVFLFKPTGVKENDQCTEDDKDREGNPVPYDVRFGIISGCLSIHTATLEFHAKAKSYFSYLWGEPSEAKDGSYIWEIQPSVEQIIAFKAKSKKTPELETPVSSQEPDVDAQVERHFEMMADLARGK